MTKKPGEIKPGLPILTLQSNVADIVNYANANIGGGNHDLMALASSLINYKATQNLVKVTWFLVLATIALVIVTAVEFLIRGNLGTQ